MTVAICIVLMNLYLMPLLCGIVSAEPIDVVVDSRRLFCYVESRKKGGGARRILRVTWKKHLVRILLNQRGYGRINENS